MKINSKVVKIHPELDVARNMFYNEISKKLNVYDFPKNKSDKLLAEAIKRDLMNFEIVKFKGWQEFEIKWK